MASPSSNYYTIGPIYVQIEVLWLRLHFYLLLCLLSVIMINTTTEDSMCNANLTQNPLQDLNTIERSIIKTYRKEIWARTVRAIQNYELISDGDKIAVAISGGKDSLLLAKVLQEYQRHGDVKFDLFFVSMNPGFESENLRRLKANCAHLGIDLIVKDSNIFAIAEKIAKENPCYMCARMRRGFLYQAAKELGCNKLALGHHFDDVIETTLLNVLYGGNFKTMVPKLKADNFEDMTLIRPLYLVKEHDILRFSNANGINAMNCGCTVAALKTSSKRREIKELIAKLKETYEDVDISIFRSAENVSLEAIMGYEENGKKKKFLELYKEREEE